MANQAYFPATEAERVVWLAHYSAKLPIHGPTCGLSPEEIAATQADIAFLIWILQTWNPAIQQNALEATAYKNLVATGNGGNVVPVPVVAVYGTPREPRPPGVLNRVFNQVQRIKISAGYIPAIGQDLGVIGSQDSTEHPIPEFTASVERGATAQRVKIAFTKYGHDGVSVECRRNGGAWEVIGIAMVKPWYDERPLLVADTPEVREYRLRWWDKGEANGEYSAVQKVTVGP
jgi:hypothetical protein